MPETIEQLKQQLTDKYVVIDASVPELRRFDGYVGQVKTVNMNGRALVEFDAWSNIGWYDIDVGCLKVVPKPDPAAAKAKAEPAPKAAPADKPAAAKPAAKTGEGKMSPLEMARMQGAAKGGGAAAPEKKAAAPAPAGKKSTADILAAARGNAAAPAAASSAPAEAKAAKPAAAAAVAQAKKPAGDAPKLTPGQRPSVSEILAWCRQHDAK